MVWIMAKISKKEKRTKFLSMMKHVWEAVRRNASYRADFQNFKIQLKKDPVVALRRFKAKWHISPRDPSLSFDQILERWHKGMELGYKVGPFPIELLYRKGQSNFPIFYSPASIFQKGFDLTVNAERPKEEILSAIEELLTHRENFRHTIKKTERGRFREMSVDPWKVYDMHKEEGMTFLKITHDLFKEIGHPAYDKRVSSHYKQVKRAYQKAQSLIESVTPE